MENRKTQGKIEEKVNQNDYFLSFFYLEYFLLSFFGEGVENIILNEMSHKKFESNKHYRFLISGIILSKNSSKQLKFV